MNCEKPARPTESRHVHLQCGFQWRISFFTCAAMTASLSRRLSSVAKSAVPGLRSLLFDTP